MTFTSPVEDQPDWPEIGQRLIDEGRFLEAVEAVQRAALSSDERTEAARLLDLALGAIAAGPADLVHRELRVLSAPEEPNLRLDLGGVYRRLGRFACAERQFQEAMWLGLRADALVELAALYLELDLRAEAGAHAREAIASAVVGNALVSAMAWRILADLAELEGDVNTEKSCLAKACAQGSVFAQPAPNSPFETLLLSVSGESNTPTDTLLPPQNFGRLVWFVDNATPEELANPPFHHVAFNSVGDADGLEAAALAMAEFAKATHRALLNSPDKVAATRRDRASRSLAGVDDLVVPQVFRVTAQTASAVAEEVAAADPDRLALWLHRPAGRHGGDGLERLSTGETLSRLSQAQTGVTYVTRYHHYRSADGFYRKYRVIFVDREVFPYHLAIAPDWLVHHRSAGMETDPARRAEEMAFLGDPCRVLGHRAFAAVANIGTALGLDFAGVDFAVKPDGRVLLFEANAAMCVHLEPDGGVFAEKNLYIERIISAFQRMLAKAAAEREAVLGRSA